MNERLAADVARRRPDEDKSATTTRSSNTQQ